jgi:hypothetical protein
MTRTTPEKRTQSEFRHLQVLQQPFDHANGGEQPIAPLIKL